MLRLIISLILASGILIPGSSGAIAAPEPVAPTSRPQMMMSFAPIVRASQPAVVNIYTRQVVSRRMVPVFGDAFIQQFFGDMLPPGLSRERVQQSLGSGVIVQPDGLVVTSAHVVEGADEVIVVLADRREFEGKIVASDKRTDLAVLRITPPQGEQLPVLRLTEPEEAVQVGDLVLAIGNPFGVGQTVTMGIISAMARSGVGATQDDYFIQTDAAINPGNSGGALVTADGRLAGINTAIFSSRDGGGSLGIGFAVPADMVRAMLRSVASGKQQVVRPWLGLKTQPVTADIAASLGMPHPAGILVRGMHPSSPGIKAGLKAGDVILAINSRSVDNEGALRFISATLPIGGNANLEVLRQGKSMTVTFPLISAPEDPPRHQILLSRGYGPLSGASVANLSPALVEELHMKDDSATGVVVFLVTPGSAASVVGLQPGDVILEVNGVPVQDTKALEKMRSQRERNWRVRLNRDGQILDLVVRG
ncbi:MAG: Do family serine endopeptidase [Alphaproteobacteria bacterium]|nr:MAG: Do family serine endopeptidase [Alphaproteobacteria bacterium]